jgi:hypothetical protein
MGNFEETNVCPAADICQLDTPQGSNGCLACRPAHLPFPKWNTSIRATAVCHGVSEEDVRQANLASSAKGRK